MWANTIAFASLNCFTQLLRRQSRMIRENDLRCQPELGLSVRMCDVDMDSFLFAGEEEQSIGAIASNGR